MDVECIMYIGTWFIYNTYNLLGAIHIINVSLYWLNSHGL